MKNNKHRIYSQDIGMEFGIEKCALFVVKSGKRHQTDGRELSNQDKIRTLAENETYKYLRNLEADTIKQVDMKDKIQKEYLIRTRKLPEAKLSSRKEEIPGLYQSLDTRDLFSSEQEMNLDKCTKELEN